MHWESAIIWDYFGVIAQDAFWYTAAQIAKGRGTHELMDELHHKVDLGQITWDEYCRAVSVDISVPYDEVVDRYQQHNIKPETIMAIKHLPEHTHVLLSNASHTYLLPIMERLGLNSLFKQVFVSSSIGYAKPDKRAFEVVLKMMDVEAQDAIMVDDSPGNVEAARAIGMKGIVFEPGNDVLSAIRRLVV